MPDVHLVIARGHGSRGRSSTALDGGAALGDGIEAPLGALRRPSDTAVAQPLSVNDLLTMRNPTPTYFSRRSLSTRETVGLGHVPGPVARPGGTAQARRRVRGWHGRSRRSPFDTRDRPGPLPCTGAIARPAGQQARTGGAWLARQIASFGPPTRLGTHVLEGVVCLVSPKVLEPCRR